MINVSIAGIGGQGSVLAAKILAQAAQAKGWQVRTTETTGMAQRGGDVMSHVRMGDAGETVFSPLPARGTVDVLIAMEPGEGARALPFLRPGGLLVCATSAVAPVAQSMKAAPYDPRAIVRAVEEDGVNLVMVDDATLLSQLGTRKALNIVMLASALAAVDLHGPYASNALSGALDAAEIEAAIRVCVRPKFLDLNLRAMDAVLSHAKVDATE